MKVASREPMSRQATLCSQHEHVECAEGYQRRLLQRRWTDTL